MKAARAFAVVLAVVLLSGYAWWAEGVRLARVRDRHVYRAFVARNSGYARPISRRELDTEIRRVVASIPPRSSGLGPDALRAAIAEALNIGFLLDGIDSRPLAATAEEYAEREPYTQYHVTLQDPRLGALDAWLLVPRDGTAAHAGIVGLHGHGETPSDFIGNHMGGDLARAGYVVIIPWSHAMACNRDESITSTYLLRKGFTLMGIRVYEALLAAKYLRALPIVNPHRLAIVGHSGGSSTANLVVRLTDWFAAQVADHEVDYRDLCDGLVHCETIPTLFALAADVNDERTLGIPKLEVPYGFRTADARSGVLDFLERTQP